MPSPEEMYCSEQICIPSSFPYLLRQYAKAAIRTQPSDLLKWSTAYFRCLSLNIPPPVKPRLEYPIPRDFNGITPGWLKTLLYQLQNNLTIPFKILWDRWIGACLEHHTLIQLLCLGGFENPQAIPWLRFVAICAATLSDDLTHTMILICEILTEEPEGGSAMITLETFLDLYSFLAKIDASNGQTLRNYFFRDSLLSLWRARVSKEELDEPEKVEIISDLEESIFTKTSSEVLEEGDKTEDLDRVISCPSLPEDDQYSIEYLLKQEQLPQLDESEATDEEEENEGEEFHGIEDIKAPITEEENIEDREHEETEKPDEEEAETDAAIEEAKENEEKKSDEEIKAESEEVKEIGDESKPAEDETVKKLSTEGVEEATEEGEENVKEYASAETITDQPVRDLDLVFEEDATLREDLERLRALQQELAGETDEELEKFKCRLIEEMPLTQSQAEGIKHFELTKPGESLMMSEEEKSKLVCIAEEGSKSGTVSSETQQEGDEDSKTKKSYDDIFVEAIRGIGATVPDQLIQAVAEYMKNCAKNQHGMVMPRNIRHYSCPPLEILEY